MILRTSEQRQLFADQAYWSDLGDALGWRMYGWTGRLTASYITSQNSSVQLTASQRDDIMAAINAAREDERYG
jgi:hypothetical protein